MKKRMQITVSEDLRRKMDLSKDFYGGYSALIETAVADFLSRPVEAYVEDIEDSEQARAENDWVDTRALKKAILET